MNGLVFLILVGVVGFLVFYFLDLQLIFELGIVLVLLVFVLYSRFSEARGQFGHVKRGQWFSHTPGVGRYPAYTPRTWQGWVVFLCYFASFVGLPPLIFSYVPMPSPEYFIIVLVGSMILTTILYILIARKKS